MRILNISDILFNRVCILNTYYFLVYILYFFVTILQFQFSTLKNNNNPIMSTHLLYNTYQQDFL